MLLGNLRLQTDFSIFFICSLVFIMIKFYCSFKVPVLNHSMWLVHFWTMLTERVVQLTCAASQPGMQHLDMIRLLYAPLLLFVGQKQRPYFLGFTTTLLLGLHG